MKIKYEFVTGEIVEVEVDEEIGQTIRDSRRTEASYERKCRRHCYSLDAVDTDDKSEWFWDKDEDTFEKISDQEEQNEYLRRLAKGLESLTAKQSELIQAIFVEGKSQTEYAREHSLDKATVSKRYTAAMKKIKKYSK